MLVSLVRFTPFGGGDGDICSLPSAVAQANTAPLEGVTRSTSRIVPFAAGCERLFEFHFQSLAAKLACRSPRDHAVVPLRCCTDWQIADRLRHILVVRFRERRVKADLADADLAVAKTERRLLTIRRQTTRSSSHSIPISPG